MPDYQKGMILNCDDPEQVYYGSTVQGLAKRMGCHREKFCKWKEGKHHFVTSFTLFEKYGVKNCKIILVENCPCNNSNELRAKEAEYILNGKCLNKQVPNRSQKQWGIDNHNKIKEYHKQYCTENADKIKEYHKQYRVENTDKIKQNKTQYYKDNVEKILEHKTIQHRKQR